MLNRALPAFAFPTCILFFCPPAPRPAPPPPEQAAVPAQVRPARREVPAILAACPRIARRVNDLKPAVKKRLARVARKLPPRVKLVVTSAYRTRAEQAAIRPTFGVKARPGTSTHEDGRAVDVNVLVDGERISPRRQHRVIGQVMASEGFRYLGPRDPVHYSVPRAAADDPVGDVPDLDVMTLDELRQIQALGE